MNVQMISTKVELLPDDIQQEVVDYIEFLLQKYSPRREPRTFLDFKTEMM